MENIESEFKAQAIGRLKENSEKIHKCLEQLPERDLWLKPNSVSNSVGNILIHLCGNIGQYILSSLGETPDKRQRTAEFAAQDGAPKQELEARLQETVNRAIEIIQGCSNAQLMKERKVQGFQYSGLGIILHVVEHYSYHTGQIAFWVKLRLEKDLNLYKGINLNLLNDND